MIDILWMAIAIVWFLIPIAVITWLLSRVQVIKRGYLDKTKGVERALGLLDDFDDRMTKTRARSKENEADILRLERQFRKLSNQVASQAARDGKQEAEVAMLKMADYLQEPDAPENGEPEDARPDLASNIDPAYI